MPRSARLQTGPRAMARRPAARASNHSARFARVRRGADAPPMGTTRWPCARPAASNRVTRCREFSGDSSRGKRGRCRARRNWQGCTEPAALRRGGEIGSGWRRSGGGRLRRSSAALGGGPATRGGGEVAVGGASERKWHGGAGMEKSGGV
jgi:hypothetical protein